MAERQTFTPVMQTVSQMVFLLYTQLVLKSWNLVLFLPLSILLLFGIQCCQFAFSGWLNARDKDKLVAVTGFTISDIEPIIYSTNQPSPEILASVLSILTSMDSQFDINQAYWNCPTRQSCTSDLYSSMMQSSDNRQKYFIDNDRKAIICPATYSNELHCAFFGSIFVHSQFEQGTANWFKNFSMFHLNPDASANNNESTPSNSCVGDGKFFYYLPKLLTFLSVLLLTLVCLYFLLTTIYCITELKGGGFLQLMIRKGLSPSSYWSSVWLWTSIEVLLLSICITMSFNIQCPSLYSRGRGYIVLLIITTFLLCAVSFMLLMTVLTTDYCTICKCTIAYIIAVGVLAIGNRLAQEAPDFVGLQQLQVVLLLLPCGNFAEQLQANLVGQVNPHVENKFHTAGILVNILFIVLAVTVTLYLDYVLPSGNALRYPYLSLFCSSSSSRQLPDISNHRPGIESIRHGEVVVRFAQVFAKPQTNGANRTDAQSGQLSVDLYDSQITAVIADNSLKVNEFLGILTGRRPVASGQVWINGRIAADCQSRPFSPTRLSVCPAEDALCSSLTVQHTLQMALISGGADWAMCEQDIHPTITLLRLLETLPRQVSSLSSGQARNLSIACALIGNPKLVVLLEPTRHLDPASRQRLWRLLDEHRLRRRCIVVGVAAHSPSEINEMDRRANRLILLSSPSGQSVVCAGSAEHIRQSVNCELTVQAHLRDTRRGSAALEKLRSGLSSSLNSKVQFSLDDELLSVHFDSRLARRDSRLLTEVIKGFKVIEQDVDDVGLKRLTLSETFNRLKRMNAQRVDNLFLNDRRTNSFTVGNMDKNTGDESTSGFDQTITVPRNLDASFKEVTQGIFYFSCLLYRRSCFRIFCQSIILPIVLIAFFAALLLVEKNWLSKIKMSHSISELSMKQFTRGVCIYDSDVPPAHKIDQHRCSLFLTGSVYVGHSYVAIPKQKNAALYDFLQKPSVLRQIHNHCTTARTNELPCPVVYANTWNRGSSNFDRQLVIGSYSIINGRPEFAASSAYIASLAAIDYFMPGNNKSVINFDVFIVSHFHSVALPLIGQTFQIFIVSILPAYYIGDVLKHKEIKWPSYLVSMGVSSSGYWTSQLIIHWLQYAPVYCVTVVIRNIINPAVYAIKHQWLVSVLTVTVGLINNLLFFYIFSIFSIPWYRRLIPMLFLIISIFISSASVLLPTIFPLCAVLIFALPPFATGLLSYYSTKAYHYSLEFLNFVTNGGDISQYSMAVYSEKHVLLCLIAIPVQFVMLVAFFLLFESARDRFCSNNAAGEEKNVSSRNATDGDYAHVASGSSINAVELNHMTKQFDPSNCAVRDVNLGVKPGELLSLIGSTGSGMTTVISAIGGRLSPTSGECRIRCGISGRSLSGRPARLSSAMAVSSNRSPLFKVVTIAEHVRFYAGLLGVSSEREAQLLQNFHLDNCKEKPVGQLSLGQKRRLGLIITLMKSSPTVLVADDVAVGVNSPKEMDIWKAIALNRNAKMSVIVSAHDLNGAEAVASSVALINQGKLICIEKPDQLRKSFGIYILEIDLAARSGQTKVNVLRKLVARFFETTVLDQTMSWIKIALPEQSVQPPMESLSWLLQLKSQLNEITDILFYPASSDQLLEYVLESHDKHSRKRASISAPPLVELPEFCDV